MQRIFIILVGLLAAWLVVAPAISHAQTPTIEEAITTLETAADALENGDTETAESLLSGLRAVTLADGTTINLAEETWDEVLAQSPQTAATTLRDLATRLRTPQTTLPDDSRERLEDVLSRPEFQETDYSLLERFLRWLSDLLPDASPETRGLFDAMVGVVGVIAIGALVFFVVRMVRRNMHKGDTLDTFGEIPIHAAEAQEKATSAAGTGDFREAMRLLYLAALLHLDEVGLLRFDRTLTNQEVLATVVNRALLHTALRPVVTQFDRVWYGHAPFGETDFQQMQGQIEELRRMNPPKGTVR
jgi:hypothetical protein